MLIYLPLLLPTASSEESLKTYPTLLQRADWEQVPTDLRQLYRSSNSNWPANCTLVVFLWLGTVSDPGEKVTDVEDAKLTIKGSNWNGAGQTTQI